MRAKPNSESICEALKTIYEEKDSLEAQGKQSYDFVLS
jgi:hypothetical protein